MKFTSNDAAAPQESAEEQISKEHRRLAPHEKIKIIECHFAKIMETLGLDLSDDSLKKTPLRVAKMYVNELFMGLNPVNEPTITLFENKFKYQEVVLEKDIPVYSYCEHHFVPIIGKAHVAYLSKGEVIGLSKLNRIVHYCSKRPQIQERLTIEIAEYLKKAMNIEDVAVVLKAEHLCVASRGIKHAGCSTITHSLNGVFLESNRRNELYSMITI